MKNNIYVKVILFSSIGIVLLLFITSFNNNNDKHLKYLNEKNNHLNTEMKNSLEQVEMLYYTLNEKYKSTYENCLKVHKKAKELLSNISATNENASKIQAIKSFKEFLIETSPRKEIYTKKITGLMDPLCNYINEEKDSALINAEIRGVIYMVEKDFVNDIIYYEDANDLRFEKVQAMAINTTLDGKSRAEFVLACKDSYRIPYVLVGDIDTITLQPMSNQKFDTLYNTNNSGFLTAKMPARRNGYYQGLILYKANNGNLLRFPLIVN